MTRLLILSDFHLEQNGAIDPFFDPVSVLEADIAVVAGDVHSPAASSIAWLRKTIALKMPVVFVLGNHEFYGSEIDLGVDLARDAASECRNEFYPISVLEDESVVVNGVQFIGSTLWTDYALYADIHNLEGRDRDVEIASAMDNARRMLRDHRQISMSIDGQTQPFSPADARQRHHRSRAFIEQTLSKPFGGPTIVVTHHAPHPRSISPGFENSMLTPAFVSDLSDVMMTIGPDLWVHGHVHSSHEYDVGRTRVVANPAGYRTGNRWENAAFDPTMIVEIGK